MTMRAIEEGWVARLGAPRPLRFTSATEADDLATHVRAGSGLRRWGRRLVVVQDDVSALALLDEEAGTVEPLLLPRDARGHRSFSSRRGNKAAKMDLEACVVLPDGRLVALGSGSTEARERLVVVDHELHVRVVDAHALYAHLRATPVFAGSELNVEGAVVVEGRVRLFQRGNGAVVGGVAPVNAVGDLRLDAFLAWLDDAGPAPTLAAVRPIDLGRVGQVPFGFTDATALPDGRVVFLGGAEGSPDTYRDGDVLGARIGCLDGDHLTLADILDPSGAPTASKLEGVDFVATRPDGALEFLVVADMDDPDVPTALATLTWGPP
jgi:hypothetical protein